MADEQDDARILRRSLWVLVICAGALCALAAGFAVAVQYHP